MGCGENTRKPLVLYFSDLGILENAISLADSEGV